MTSIWDRPLILQTHFEDAKAEVELLNQKLEQSTVALRRWEALNPDCKGEQEEVEVPSHPAY